VDAYIIWVSILIVFNIPYGFLEIKYLPKLCLRYFLLWVQLVVGVFMVFKHYNVI